MSKRNAFKIEKGIKPPEMTYQRVVYPFLEMKVGDSFLIGANTSDAQKVRQAASRHKIRGKVGEFSIRKTESGYRCWRIA